MPQASNSVGSILKIGMVAVAKLTKIGAPEMSKAEIDVTTLDSTGGYKEFIPDFRDGGTVSIEGFAVNDAGQIALKTNFDAETNAAFTIETPGGLNLSFSGYVSKFKKGDVAVGQGVTFTGELRVSGVVALTEEASVGCSAIAFQDDADHSALTNFAIVPAFAIGTYDYVATFDTEDSVEVVATNATGSTTMHLYVNDVFSQALTTTVPSPTPIAFPVGLKNFKVVVWQTGKSPLTYNFNVGRTA
jgi:predicted secreted protein